MKAIVKYHRLRKTEERRSLLLLSGEKAGMRG
jgi:hypothetical protein